MCCDGRMVRSNKTPTPMNWIQNIKNSAKAVVQTALTESRNENETEPRVSFRSDNVPALSSTLKVKQHPWSNVLRKYGVSDDIAEFVREVIKFICLFLYLFQNSKKIFLRII